MSEITVCPKCGKKIKFNNINGVNIPLTCQCVFEENKKQKEEILKHGYIKIKQNLIDKSGVRKRYRNILFADIKHVPGQEKAYNKALNFVKEYKSGEIKNGFGFFGGVGSGKTYITTAIINEIIAYRLERLTDEEKENACFGKFIVNAPIIFIGFTELFELIKPNIDDSEELMRKIKKTKLLVIDDLGACKLTDWKSDKLFELIDYRYSEELPIIFTTNLIPDELKTVVGDRIIDRLKAMCEEIVITSKSQRIPPTK